MTETKLTAMKKLAVNLGVDAAAAERCVTNSDALNLISQHIGGADGATTIAEAIENIAEVASGGGASANDMIKTMVERPLPITYDIPEGISKIGPGAFAYWYGFNAATIPSTVKSIESYAFYETTIDTIEIPFSVTTIGNKAFGNTGYLESVTFPESLTSIGTSCFENAAITSVEIKCNAAGLSVNQGAFANCSSLKTVAFLSDNSEATVTLHKLAFENDGKLTTATFRGCTFYIDSTAFTGCGSLADIYVDWAEGAVANAPWGATNATIHYNSAV